MELVKEEASQFNKITQSKELALKEGHSTFFKGQPRVAGEGVSQTSPLASGLGGVDLNNVEVLQKIEKFTQDANEIMRQKYLKNIWTFEDLHES